MTDYIIPLDDSLYDEMQAHADTHELSVAEVVTLAWRLYRDVSAMRDDTYNVPRAALAAHQQAATPQEDTASMEWCPHCWGYHDKGTVEQCPMRP